MIVSGPVRTALAIVTVLPLAMLACVGGPTATEQPVDPAGVWIFGIVVTLANGICAGDEGESSAHPITITKTGSAPPYAVTASGFLGDPLNVLTGTFDENNRFVITGTYPEDGGTNSVRHDLVATSANRMEGVENWSWDGSSGTCTNSTSDVIADRM